MLSSHFILMNEKFSCSFPTVFLMNCNAGEADRAAQYKPKEVELPELSVNGVRANLKFSTDQPRWTYLPAATDEPQIKSVQSPGEQVTCVRGSLQAAQWSLFLSCNTDAVIPQSLSLSASAAPDNRPKHHSQSHDSCLYRIAGSPACVFIHGDVNINLEAFRGNQKCMLYWRTCEGTAPVCPALHSVGKVLPSLPEAQQGPPQLFSADASTK